MNECAMKRSRRRIIGLLLLSSLSVLTLAVALLVQWRGLDWRLPLRRLFPNSVTRVRPLNAVAAKIVAGARQQEGTRYNASYVPIAYPNGDVPLQRGACTDVVVRALRNAGYDLQRLIHEDMKCHFKAYPKKWGLKQANPNIDHRRVPNQMRFFERHGARLTTEVTARTRQEWQPGDFVYWDVGHGQLHTGVLSDGINAVGVPLVVHNGSICAEADCLTRWKIIGHFRYPAGEAELGTRNVQRRNRNSELRIPPSAFRLLKRL